MNALRIVVADDHALVRSSIAAYLRSFGAEIVAEAANGADAIACARDLSPDLVIMDGNMPGMNGYEATRTIKAVMPNVHVAIVSVSAGTAYEQQAALSSADVFIPKSSLKESLRTLMQHLVSEQTAPRVGAAA